MTGTRIQKLLAAQGFGSRRTIEELLAAGKVRVNGKVATLGDRAEPTDLFVLTGRVGVFAYNAEIGSAAVTQASGHDRQPT